MHPESYHPKMLNLLWTSAMALWTIISARLTCHSPYWTRQKHQWDLRVKSKKKINSFPKVMLKFSNYLGKIEHCFELGHFWELLSWGWVLLHASNTEKERGNNPLIRGYFQSISCSFDVVIIMAFLILYTNELLVKENLQVKLHLSDYLQLLFRILKHEVYQSSTESYLCTIELRNLCIG